MRHSTRLIILALVAGAIFAIAAFFGRRNHATAVARRQLPTLPATAGRGSEFVRRLREADTAARAEPKSSQRLAELGSLYHANGYIAEAKRCWLALAAMQPGEGRWPYYLADVATAESDDDAVAAQLARTVELAPSYAPAWLTLGDFEFKRGESSAAERAYRQRLALQPGDPYAQLGIARLDLQHGDRAAAKERLVALLRDHAEFASAHNLYAELAEADGDVETAKRQRWLGAAAGRYRPAEDPWKEALRAYCYDPGQLLIWADIDLQTKFGDRGKRLFERAVELAPNDSAAWQKLGEFYLSVKEPAKAFDAFAHAWRLPDGSEVLGNELNDVCIELGRYTEALQFMDEGLRRLPKSSIFHNARGVALAGLGRTEDAIAEFRIAIDQASNNPAPLANLGLALLQRGQRAEGRRYLREALKVQPGFPKALAAEARLELQERDFESAARLIVPYFEQFPGVRDARLLMADFQLARALDTDRRGDAAAAERICRAALADIPESAKLHEFLGIQFLKRNNLTEAVQELETAHRNDPADVKCVTLLATVYVQQGRADEAQTFLQTAATAAAQRGDRSNADRFNALAAQLRSRR